MKFPVTVFSVNVAKSAGTFTEEILNVKLIFCAVFVILAVTGLALGNG